MQPKYFPFWAFVVLFNPSLICHTVATISTHTRYHYISSCTIPFSSGLLFTAVVTLLARLSRIVSSREHHLITRHLPRLETHVRVVPLFIVVHLSFVYVLITFLFSLSGDRVGLFQLWLVVYVNFVFSNISLFISACCPCSFLADSRFFGNFVLYDIDIVHIFLFVDTSYYMRTRLVLWFS